MRQVRIINKAISRAESLHRFILSSLRKICQSHADWADRLPGLLLSLHSSVVTSTGLSPSYMVFHRELRVPIMARLQVTVDTQDKTLSQLMDTARVTDELIQENTQQSFQQADKFYNRHAVAREFQIGQQALLYDEKVPIGVMRKMHRFYRPVEIFDVLPNSCYKLKDTTSGRLLPFKVHVSRLKALKEGNISEETGHETITSQRPQVKGDEDGQQQHQMQQQQQQQLVTADDEAWHAILSIRSRRRRPTGQYEYLVEWAADHSTSWLPARSITPELVRTYNARCRRRKRY